MANEEHVKILKQGVEVWNKWRKENREVKLDLNGANLRGAILRGAILNGAILSEADLSEAILFNAKLSRANLKGSNLRRANFIRANLIEANLEGVNLQGSNFIAAYLMGANFEGANLEGVNLEGVNLSNANLGGADLTKANLSEANLFNANLRRASLKAACLSRVAFNSTKMLMTNFEKSSMFGTFLGDCDLSQAFGLDKVVHIGPSSIGIDTIMKSRGNIPISFLKGCGVTQEVIDNILPLSKGTTLEFYSCFISYSTKDEMFAEKLKNDLMAKNVRCWYFPDDAKWGRDIYDNIDQAVRLYDKLVIICSKNSLNSEPVLREIDRGLQKEKRQKEPGMPTKRVLFPIAIDSYFFDDWDHYLKPDLQRITVGDFRSWKDPDEYKKAFDRLLEGLNKE